MADFTAEGWTWNYIQGNFYTPTAALFVVPSTFNQPSTLGSVRLIKMVWLDVDALPTVLYRVWTVTDQPDPTGLFYTGPKSGSTAITNATIEEDFNT